MGTKKQQDKPNKKDFIIGIFLASFCLISLYLVWFNNYFPEQCEGQRVSYLLELEKIDRLSSCYKGCQYTTQPIYNNAVEDKEFRIKQYEVCAELCKDYYG